MNSKWTGLKILFSVGFTNHLLNAAVKRNLIVRGLVLLRNYIKPWLYDLVLIIFNDQLYLGCSLKCQKVF